MEAAPHGVAGRAGSGRRLSTMAPELAACCIAQTRTLADAMRAIDRGGAGIALVTGDGGELVGTFTDGDLRRALMRGAALDSTLAGYTQREFTHVGPEASRAEVLDLMQARLIRQIPIVGADGRLLGLHLLHEIIGAVPRPNWAVVMAGGQGTRLRPITEHVPKPMVTVAGRPILERLVLHLVGYGVRRIYLSVNYLAHIIENHFGDGQRFGCRIEYLREQTALGTGGALSLLPEQPSAPLLVLNGDLVTQVDLAAMFAFHADGGYVATMGVRRYVHEVPFGCVEIDDQRIVRLEEKPPIERLVNAGIYVLEPSLLARVPQQFFPVTSLFEDCLRNDERVGAFEIQDDWLDVGQRDQLRKARQG